MLECDSFSEFLRVVPAKGKLDSVVNRADTYWPFEEVFTSEGPEYRTHAVEEETQILLVQVYGAAGFEWIAARDALLFVMNESGATINKTTV